MKKLVFALCLVPSLALAQSAPDKEFKLSVTASDLAVIGDGIGALPYNKVAALMQKLQMQVAGQNHPVPPPAPPAPPAAAPAAEPAKPDDNK